MLRHPRELDGAGVYLLYRSGQVAYIGKSSNVAGRMKSVRQVDEYMAFLLPVSDAKMQVLVERFLIGKLDPPGNSQDAPSPRTLRVYQSHKEATVRLWQDDVDWLNGMRDRYGLASVGIVMRRLLSMYKEDFQRRHDETLHRGNRAP